MPEHTPPPGRPVRDGTETRETAVGASSAQRPTIPPPDEERLVYRAEERHDGVVGAKRSGFDLPATIAGALAALGTFVLLSALVGAVVGSIGYQADVDGRDLSIGGLIAGLVVLFLSCLVGGWVAGRMARRKGGLHGLVAVLWLVALAAGLAALAAVAGDEFDLRERVGLPDWFSSDALGTAAIITGLVALALMLLGGWLGGRMGERHPHDGDVELVEHRSNVRTHPGGIIAEDRR